MVSDDEEDEEDSSKQGRSLIEDMDLDAGISLVPPHVADQWRFDDTHVSDQPEEQLGVFSTAKVLADAARIRRGVENVHTYTSMAGVSTASGLVSTTGMAQEVEINIPSPVATKDKGKAVMQESEPPKKIKKRVQIQMSIDEELAQKLHEEEQARFNAEQEAKFNEEQEQERLDYEAAVRIQEELDESERQRMAQVHQAAQGFTDAEWDDILARVAADEDLVQQLQAGEKYSEEDLPRKLVELVNQRKKFFAQQRAEAKRNKPMTPAQQKAYMSTYIKNQEGGYSIKKLKSLSFEQVKEIFETTMRRVQSFVPMDSELEDKRLKRAGQEGLEEPAKRQKIREASGSVQEQSDEEPKADELSQEQLQQLMIIVPEEGMNVEALQTKYPIIDWEVYSEDTIKFWKIIRVGNYTEVYQVFEDMLKNFDRDDLVKLWSLVHERFNSTELTDDKAKELWVELKRLFEPDENDTLWKIQRYMHDLLTWKLYDTCGVHHVSTERGHDIFMLVEKDYPLTRALMTLMLCNKLRVDEYSEMANELLRKIFILENRPRQ
ncbi:hypothetical protein Tco_1555258 [Tanacetum coccineum]